MHASRPSEQEISERSVEHRNQCVSDLEAYVLPADFGANDLSYGDPIDHSDNKSSDDTSPHHFAHLCTIRLYHQRRAYNLPDDFAHDKGPHGTADGGVLAGRCRRRCRRRHPLSSEQVNPEPIHHPTAVLPQKTSGAHGRVGEQANN